MRICEINIKNYRNLDGEKVKLDPDINFLVGENDLGKSNFLDLLDRIFHSKRFSEEKGNSGDTILNYGRTQLSIKRG